MSDTPVIYENPKEPWSGAVGHKFVRLTEPVYYVPINPYTDDEGFLKGEGRQPQWVNDNHLVVVEWLDGARSNARPPYMHDWGKVAKYKIIGEEQEEHPTEETDHRRETAERIVQFICESEPHQETVDAQKILAEHKLERLICVPHDVLVQLIENALENEDLEEGLRLLRKHNRNLYKKSGVGENGDDPEQFFVSGDPVPFVDKPRSSDATRPREQEGVYARDILSPLSESERHNRNEIAALTLTPVPRMAEWMHDIIREARRHDFRVAAMQGMITGVFSLGQDIPADIMARDARMLADAMIEKEKEDA